MILSGFAYGVYESLCLGVPVIITKLPVLEELGVNQENGFILDFDMKNLDVHKIYDMAGKFKFEYTPKKDIWGQLLTNIKSSYEEEKNMKYRVKATSKYQENDDYDIPLTEKYGRRYVPQQGEEWEVTGDRMEKLTQLGYVTVVGAIPEIEDTQFVVKGEKIENTDEIEIIEESDEVTQGLEELTREELFSIAETLGIKCPKNIKTINLINKIQEKQNS